MRSLTLLTLIGLALVGRSIGWNKGYHHKDTHHQYSVYSRKTSHRAKSTSISVTFIDATATSVSHNPSASTAPTCIKVPSGAKDEPAIQDPETTVILREKCGVTKETVDECPYLCGPTGDEPIKACFPNDIAGSSTQDFFGVCQHCLPPCDDKDDKDKPSITKTPPSTCTNVKPGAIDTPAFPIFKFPGLLFRLSCGFTEETVEQCPYACGTTELAKVCLPSFSPACTKCVTSCGSSNAPSATQTKKSTSSARSFSTGTLVDPSCTSVLPGAKDTPASRGLRIDRPFRKTCGFTEETVEECPYACGSSKDELKICVDDPSQAASCTKCLTSCSITASPSASSTRKNVYTSKTHAQSVNIKAHTTAKTSTSARQTSRPTTKIATEVTLQTKPTVKGEYITQKEGIANIHYSGTTTLVGPGISCSSYPAGAAETPGVTAPDGFTILRESCPFSVEDVRDCHFLCGSGPLRQCEIFNLAPEVGEPACTECLPDCKLVPTCTSVAPGATDTPAVVRPGFGNGLKRLSGECGVTNETAAECPNLCGLAGELLQDCSDSFFPFQVGRFGCIRCLPICPVEATYKWDWE